MIGYGTIAGAIMAALIYLVIFRIYLGSRSGTAPKRKMIRDAVDGLPHGISFADESGIPVLTNHCMNYISYSVTGKPMLNADLFWKEIKRSTGDNESSPADIVQGLITDDGKVWRVKREEIHGEKDVFTQYSAADITDLHRMREELERSNERLKSHNKNTVALLKDIVSVNKSKELLSAKMDIHDKLGQAIMFTRHCLEKGDDMRFGECSGIWREVLWKLRGADTEQPRSDRDSLDELRRVAEMAGCRFIIKEHTDDIGSEERLLINAAVRVAMSNSIRHAGADELYCEVGRKDGRLRAEIWDNGAVSPVNVTEGSGLTGLRKRLEREGVMLDVISEHGVKLVLEFPMKGGI